MARAFPRLRIAGLCAAATALLLGAAARAQEKTITLKIAHWVPPQHPLHASLDMWGKSVEKASGGTIKYQIFPSQQLGQAKDHYDMVRDGIADFAYVNPGYTPGRFPIIAAGEIPFLFSNAISGAAALDAWYRKYAGKEMSDVKVCFSLPHSPGTFHSRARITSPDQLKGLKIRSANATIGRLVTLLGGTNVQVAAPEAREAMERGVADAITFPWDSIILFGIDRAARFHLDAPLYVSVFVFPMNKAIYEGMSVTQKRVIDDHCTTEWAERMSKPWAEREDSGRIRLMKMAGHTVVAVTGTELEAWKKIAEPITRDWMADAAKKGIDARAALEELKNELKKRNAAAF
jgi:TRAP-type transport system periplasmic protein